jgi:hypothetical protein
MLKFIDSEIIFAILSLVSPVIIATPVLSHHLLQALHRPDYQ